MSYLFDPENSGWQIFKIFFVLSELTTTHMATIFVRVEGSDQMLDERRERILLMIETRSLTSFPASKRPRIMSQRGPIW